MTRYEFRGWECYGCGHLLKPGRKDCPCQIRLDERQGEKLRAEKWKPLYAKLTVTMGSANR